MNNTTLLLPAVLLAPLSLLTSPLVSLNLLTALSVPACFAAAYWAARRTGVGRAAAAAGAAAFAISPAIVNSLVGHVTMAFAPALPVLVALSVMAWRGGPRDPSPVRAGVCLGLGAAVQVFIGEEVLFQAGVGALVVLLATAAGRPREIAAGARRLGVALGVAFAVFLPITGYPLYLQFFGPLHQEGSPFLQDYFGADLTAFTTPTDRVWLHTAADAAASARFPGGIEEHLAYLGWPLLLTCLAVTVLRRRDPRVRAAAAGFVVAAVLSLGGRLWLGGEWRETRLPYHLFQSLPVTEASLATRFGLLTALFAGALLALAVDALRRSGLPRPRLLGGAVAVLCLLPLVPRPLPTEPAPGVPAYFTSSAVEDAAGEVVVVLPYPVPTDPRAMRWQSEAGYRFSMPGGYFLGPAPDGRAYVGGGADPATARLLGEVASTGVPIAPTEADRAQATADIAAWDADRVVLGPAGSDAKDAALQATVTALLGRPGRPEGGVLVWDVG